MTMNVGADPMRTGEEAGNLTVIFHVQDDDGVVAECVELPGCFAQGDTQEEAEKNIREAINACLSVVFEDCMDRLRSRVDLGSLNLRNVSRQERFSVRLPQLKAAAATFA